MTWKLDKAGYAFITSHEAIILYTYPDPGTGGEPYTIGIGHTATAGGMKPKPGDKITLTQAINIFKQDLEKFTRRVNNAIGDKISTQAEFNGYVSFDFNTGAIISGTIDDKLRRGDQVAALRTLNAYTKAGGKRLAGLVTRRHEETELIKYGRYPKRKILVKRYPGHKGEMVNPDTLPWTNNDLSVSVDFPVIPETKPKRENVSLIEILLRGFLKWLKG